MTTIRRYQHEVWSGMTRIVRYFIVHTIDGVEHVVLDRVAVITQHWSA